MNQTILRNILIFGAGAGLGYLLAKKFLEDKYAKLAQEEIDSVKETFNKRGPTVTIGNDVENVTIISSKCGGGGGNGFGKSSLDGVYANKYNEVKYNYGIASIDTETKEEDSDDSDDDTDEENVIEMVDTSYRDKPNGPYVISEEEFSDGMPHFDKVGLYFYSIDGVLCDDDESLIHNIDEVVGDDAIEDLDTDSVAYVRNERLAIDYEITRLNASYQQSVLGIIDDGVHDGRRHRKD